MNPPKTTSILLRSSITAALGGLLFGFDTVVISGAEKTIQSLWGLSDGIHGLAVSMALWGTVLGAMIGGWPTEKFGRKNTLVAIGIMYFVSALWSGCAVGPWDFMVARFIGGMGIGISTVVSPLYISEIAPAERRGRLTGLYQFNIVAGILIAFLSNYLIGRFLNSDTAWRWMLGIEAVPALFYILASLTLPESPRWLLTRGKRPEATGILRRLDPALTPEAANLRIDEISAADEESKTGIQVPFLSKPLLRPISLAFLIAFFNQLSGINAILYFAPRIFETDRPRLRKPPSSNPSGSASPISSSPSSASGSSTASGERNCSSSAPSATSRPSDSAHGPSRRKTSPSSPSPSSPSSPPTPLDRARSSGSSFPKFSPTATAPPGNPSAPPPTGSSLPSSPSPSPSPSVPSLPKSSSPSSPS